jgi:hypothetical protein
MRQQQQLARGEASERQCSCGASISISVVKSSVKSEREAVQLRRLYLYLYLPHLCRLYSGCKAIKALFRLYGSITPLLSCGASISISRTCSSLLLSSLLLSSLLLSSSSSKLTIELLLLFAYESCADAGAQ